jgi:hypothetical protein
MNSKTDPIDSPKGRIDHQIKVGGLERKSVGSATVLNYFKSLYRVRLEF